MNDLRVPYLHEGKQTHGANRREYMCMGRFRLKLLAPSTLTSLYPRCLAAGQYAFAVAAPLSGPGLLFVVRAGEAPAN